MKWLRDFWGQDSSDYRNFQIVFGILTLNFALPTLSYIFTPDAAIAQFGQLNELLGGVAYDVPENQGFFWRFLGIANVAALAFMCGLLQWDLRRNHRVVVPLTFLKATAATAWLVGYIQHPEYPAFVAAAILDYATSAAFAVFAGRAHRDIDDRDDDALVPRPARARRGTLTDMERRMGQSLFEAMLPEGDVHPGFEGIDSEAFWTEVRHRVPGELSMGLRAAIWLLSLWPIASGFALAPFSRLDGGDKHRLLERASQSRVYPVRESVELIKMLACFGYFADPEQREHYRGLPT